jgi:hypothetical protein
MITTTLKQYYEPLVTLYQGCIGHIIYPELYYSAILCQDCKYICPQAYMPFMGEE